jgi:3,4-dihydroxy-2-butanone 4-phosphate synthase
MEDIKLDSIEEAIEAIRQGKVIIVVDDEDRENEGDFICGQKLSHPKSSILCAKKAVATSAVRLQKIVAMSWGSK